MLERLDRGGAGTTNSAQQPGVSVLMATYGQAAFIGRAIESLLNQSYAGWELLIVDDASPDATRDAVTPYLVDPRIRFTAHPENRGLGAALNTALDEARAPLIAYLPSDDVYYRDHLATLCACLCERREAVLAYSGVRHHYNRSATGVIDGFPLQLVQVLHRRGDERWLERRELVTDDLDRMFWSGLRERGTFVGTGRLSCEWIDHPQQLHKLLREPVGGINLYRDRFRVREPLRFHSSQGNRIDEVSHFQRFRERPDTPLAADGLTILLVGELAYNPERVLALEERGNKLYGLWMPEPYWYNTVGPLPFGHVEDVPRTDWQAAVRRIKPDIIYALLNWQAVPFAHSVLMQNPGIPFVWHFKEGPFICLEKGSWPQLIDLSTRSDAQIYSSPEMRDWYATFLPGSVGERMTLCLDGDLPKRDWFDAAPSPRLSDVGGELHTVVPGRPIGLHPRTVAELAEQGIHLHFYGDFTQGQWRTWIETAMALAPGRLHLHAHVDQDRWVSEFSQYDAGWLHFAKSENEGDIRRATWDDLNYPARIATLAAAGLPMLQYDNRDAVVATQSLVRQRDLGLFFTNMPQLGQQLRDRPLLERLRANVWRQRERFTFDSHADRLLDFFRSVLQHP